MLTALLVWLYTGFLCYVYGHLLLKSLRIRGDFPAPPLVVALGLVVLTTFASFFSLFFQIGLLINLLLSAGAIGAILTRSIPAPRIRRPVSWIALIVLSLALLVILENATHRPLNPDTNIYHAQAIHWIESFPAVPGLGNLHGRLAFNSSWLVANALFSLSFLGLGSFHLTGSFLFLLVLAYCLDGFNDIARGTYTPAALLKAAFFPLAFWLLGAEISSPGTDLPISLLLWLLAVLWAEHSQQAQPFHPTLIVLLAVFAVTVKLSAAPVLLFLLVMILPFLTGFTRTFNAKTQSDVLSSSKGRRDFKQKSQTKEALQTTLRPLRLRVNAFSAWLTLCALFVLLPFLIRNLILSGYLLYPLPTIDLFSFDWKVPLERVVGEQMSVLAWGRFPRLDAAQVLAMPPTEWIPRWLADQTPNRRLIFWAALLSFLPALAALSGLRITRRTPNRQGFLCDSASLRQIFVPTSKAQWAMRKSYWLGWLVFYAGTFYWLFSAPDFRFGYGFLIGTILLALAPWFAALLQRTALHPTRISATIALLMTIYLGITLFTSFEARTFAARLLVPAPYDHIAVQPCPLANGTVFCAKAYNECAYDAFPCIPSPRPNVALRGLGWGDGFKTLP